MIRARDSEPQFTGPGNNDTIDPDRAKWGWIAACVTIVAGPGAAIYDSIAG